MHLAILTQYYPPEIGAPQKRLSEFVARFTRRGHTVTVLTAMPNYPTGKIHQGYGGLFRRDEVNGVPVLRTWVYPTQSVGLIKRMASYFSFVCSSMLVGTFALPKVDALLVESPPLFLGISGLWLSRVRGTRMIFNVSDLWPDIVVDLGMMTRESLAYRLSARLERFLYRSAWLVSGQARGILDHVRKVAPRARTFHLSNGVDTSVFHPEATSDALPAIPAQGVCSVVYAGLHGIAQGLDQALDAAAALRAEGGMHFYFIGDGPEKEKLMRISEERGLDNVSFHDPVLARDIPGILARMDIALVPLCVHIPGSVPSKVYEAMAMAKPVLAVVAGEAAEIVTAHGTGIAIAPGDIEGLVTALRTLRDQPALRASYGAKGREAAETVFSRDRLVAAFIDELEQRLHEEQSRA
jgi:glycosyltransferase involved in cell wall biosynthesis